MIELVGGLPDGVVGFEAVGKVTPDDYDLVRPVVERALERHAKIRLLHIIGNRFTGHTVSALWEDASLGLANARSIERIAVVTDLAHFRALVRSAGWLRHEQVRLFSNAERAQAIVWVSQGL